VLVAGVLMRALGVGLNTMSLGGLAIAVGIMVDASIIMVENMYHRFHQHFVGGAGRLGGAQGPGGVQTTRPAPSDVAEKEAVAHRAAMEVGRPIAFATMIIVAVFVPLFLMGGIEGLMFRPLAVTVAAAMLVALALSLIFTPMVSLRFLKPRPNDDPEGEVAFVKWIKRGYVPALDYALQHRGAVILVTLALIIPTAIGVKMVGKDFMPKLDEGALVIAMATPPETSLEEADRIDRQVEEIVRRNPNVETTTRRTGHTERAMGCILPVNLGEIAANLKPPGERKCSTEEVLTQIRKDIAVVPGVAFSFTQPFQMKVDEGMEVRRRRCK